jgi:phospholipase C
MDSRRSFLKKAMLLSGASGLSMMLPESISRAMAIDPKAGSTFLDAEHIVVLMQENRSFDHCFGSLRGIRGLNDPRAIMLPDQKPVWMQSNALGETHVPFRLNMQDTKVTWIGDLPHSRSSQVDANNNGKYDKWLDVKKSSNKKFEKIPLTLGQFTRDDLPFHYAMADAFTICDQNFSSAMTSTTPNRSFFWSGKITHPSNGVDKVHIRNTDYSLAGMPWGTFPELLEENNVSWRFYQNALTCGGGFTNTERSWLTNFGGNILEFFAAYNVKFTAKYVENIQRRLIDLPGQIEKLKKEKPISNESKQRVLASIKKKEEVLAQAKIDYQKWNKESFDKLPEKAKILYKKAFVINDGDPNHRLVSTLQYNYEASENETEVPKGDIFHQFRKDVKADKLPTVTWLASPQNFSDHPSSPWYGAWYVSEVMDILTENPEIWKKTIFILTYDENDGFFDHIPPFSIPDNNKSHTGKVSAGIDTEVEHVRLEKELAQGISKKEAREAPIGLGFRVPMLIASPWSRGGKVCSQVFDHTSTLQFLETFVNQKFRKNIKFDNISKWRKTICGDLTSVFSPFSNAQDKELPFLDRNNYIESIYNAKFKKDPVGLNKITDADLKVYQANPKKSNILMRQEPGVRKSCALPYDISANGVLSKDKKEFIIDFSVDKAFFKDKTAGSPFTVYAPVNFKDEKAESDICRNWHFAVVPGDKLSYAWPLAAFANNSYHLRLHGPNGFYREFLGDSSSPEIVVNVKPELNSKGNITGNVVVQLQNIGKQAQKISIIDNAYKNGVIAVNLNDGAKKDVILNLKDSYNWYDFSIKTEDNNLYRNSYAGRVETGVEGFSDPNMA